MKSKPKPKSKIMPEPDSLQAFQRREAALLTHGFVTNDLVYVDSQTPKVNGRELDLKSRASALLVLLATQAAAAPGVYLTSEDIVAMAFQNALGLGKLGLSWKPSKNDVYGAVSELRSAMERKRLSDKLVQKDRAGYRLSTAPGNIWIHLPGVELFAWSRERINRGAEFPFPNRSQSASDANH